MVQLGLFVPGPAQPPVSPAQRGAGRRETPGPPARRSGLPPRLLRKEAHTLTWLSDSFKEFFRKGDPEGAEYAMAIHMRHSMDVMELE